MSSAAVGGVLGAVGGLLLPGRFEAGALVALALLALVVVTRELGVIAIPLPQPRRQTRERWGKTYPRPVAATLWGLDLGLVFTTWFTFSGTWIVILIAVASASPVFGALLLTVHWLGRALAVWVAPLLLSDANETPFLMDRIDAERRSFVLAHVAAVVWIAGALTVAAAARMSLWS
jgi:hypothetical protein